MGFGWGVGTQFGVRRGKGLMSKQMGCNIAPVESILVHSSSASLEMGSGFRRIDCSNTLSSFLNASKSLSIVALDTHSSVKVNLIQCNVGLMNIMWFCPINKMWTSFLEQKFCSSSLAKHYNIEIRILKQNSCMNGAFFLRGSSPWRNLPVFQQQRFVNLRLGYYFPRHFSFYPRHAPAPALKIIVIWISREIANIDTVKWLSSHFTKQLNKTRVWLVISLILHIILQHIVCPKLLDARYRQQVSICIHRVQESAKHC